MGRNTQIRSFEQRVNDAVDRSRKRRESSGSGCLLPATFFTLGTFGLYVATNFFPEINDAARQGFEYLNLHISNNTFDTFFKYVAPPLISGFLTSVYSGLKLFSRHRSIERIKDIEAVQDAVNDIAHEIDSHGNGDGILNWINSFRRGNTADIFSVLVESRKALREYDSEKKLNDFLATILKNEGYVSAVVGTYPDSFRIERGIGDFHSKTALEPGSELEFSLKDLNGDVVAINDLKYKALSFELSKNVYILYVKPV